MYKIAAVKRLQRKNRPFRKTDIRIPLGGGRYLIIGRETVLPASLVEGQKLLVGGISEDNLQLYRDNVLLTKEQALAVANGASGVVTSVNVSGDPDAPSFSITVTVEGEGYHELELDHSLENDFPEFSVYADSDDPYNGKESEFTDWGASATYTEGTWTIDFGATATGFMKSAGTFSVYLVVRDENGIALFGSMSPPTPENTFEFNFEVVEEGGTEGLEGGDMGTTSMGGSAPMGRMMMSAPDPVEEAPVEEPKEEPEVKTEEPEEVVATPKKKKKTTKKTE